MDDAIEQVIADVRRYTEAGERLAERLHQHTRWNEEDVERLRAGVSLTDSCHATGSAQRSRDLTRILAEFEESRRAIRSSTVLALLDEGMTISEIAQVFGVSRQLANRLVKDARMTSGQTPASA